LSIISEIGVRKVGEYGLTPRQKKFADFYLQTGNASESYRMAGFKVNTSGSAEVSACKLLRKDKIKKYIAEVSIQIDNPRIAGRDEVLEKLTEHARGETIEEVVGFSMDGDTLRADKRISIKDQIKALELIGKRYLLWNDKADLNVGLDVNLNVRYGDESPKEEG